MKDVLRSLAAQQAGCFAVWQLHDAGWTRGQVRHAVRDLRDLHDGVYLTGDAPVTRLQRWWAATLTARGSVLAFASAGAAYEMRPWEGGFEVIVRQGSGGPRRNGALLLCRTKRVESTTLNGLLITTPERTLADLWPRVNDPARMLRNALRLKLLTIPSLSDRRLPRSLREAVGRHQDLRLHRCRSDAEAAAVVILAEVGEQPQINTRIAGEEADLTWPARRLIVEIDGAAFHQDKLEDARKTAIWRAAGFDVERVPAQDVYDNPQRLIRAARPGS